MSDEMDIDDDQMLAAEYVLGLLTGQDLARADRLVVEDRDFADAVLRWELALAELADEVEPVPVPAAAKRRVQERLFDEEANTALGAIPGGLRVSLAFWRRVAAVAVLLAVVLGALLVNGTGGRAPDLLRAAEITSDDGDFRYLAVLDATEGVLQVTRISGQAPEGRVLQVWAHGDDQPAISVGLFGTGETARLPLPAALRGITGTFTMGISEEPPGGSTQDGPSGEVLGLGEIGGL
ncbi:anti-sigma factor [Marinibacterium sp. SX1]|uniref:anti-sigma factor n=1 Tax=Marinibacterium sp. SX1 TaxID=3388424 RepID=UPI003D182FA2